MSKPITIAGKNKIEKALLDKSPKGGIYAKKIPKENSAKLKDKILLIPDDLVPEGIDSDLAGRYYKHPFRIATQEEIEVVISLHTENTAYLHYLWSDRERMYVGTVIDAHSGELMGTLGPGAARIKKPDCLPPGTSTRTLLRMKAKKLKEIR